MYIHIYVCVYIHKYIFLWTGRGMTDMRSETWNACETPSTTLRSAGPGSTKHQISHQLTLASSGNKELESGVHIEASHAIWDTLKYPRMADMTQLEQLDAKQAVLVHLKEHRMPILGNQNCPRYTGFFRSFENLCTQSLWRFIFNSLAATKNPPYSYLFKICHSYNKSQLISPWR